MTTEERILILPIRERARITRHCDTKRDLNFHVSLVRDADLIRDWMMNRIAQEIMAQSYLEGDDRSSGFQPRKWRGLAFCPKAEVFAPRVEDSSQRAERLSEEFRKITILDHRSNQFLMISPS